ncbi:MAG: hypothetical protein JW849_00470 [Phycisphaerae bacterium]|nr:hypothetical protein [Phycisphaerae bacterium]
MRGESKFITDDELLYRRIPAHFYDPQKVPPVMLVAFRPSESDKTGLSLDRDIFVTPEQSAAYGREGRSFYVAVLCAEDLRTCGMEVNPKPLPGKPGHAEISNLTHENRDGVRQKEWRDILATRLCREILGPFPGKAKPPEKKG